MEYKKPPFKVSKSGNFTFMLENFQRGIERLTIATNTNTASAFIITNEDILVLAQMLNSINLT